MLTILLIGLLLLLGVSLMMLDAAIEHVAEGYEDELGFHQEPREWSPEPASAESGVTLWDQMEGACCPLDMRPAFRPINESQFDGSRQLAPTRRA